MFEFDDAMEKPVEEYYMVYALLIPVGLWKESEILILGILVSDDLTGLKKGKVLWFVLVSDDI